MAAIEQGCTYQIWNPAVTDYVAFNTPADANFVGYLTDVTGLDDAGVRENAQVITAGDGGYHGPFWRDRRPWTLTGTIMPQFPLLARDNSQQRIEYIVGQAMRADGFLVWSPADGVPKFVSFRKQQPIRMPKGQSNVERTFTIAGVTSDWRVLSWGAGGSGGGGGVCPINFTITNLGNANAAPSILINGPLSSPFLISNLSQNRVIKIDYSVAVGDTVTVDLTGTYPRVFNAAGTNIYGLVEPLASQWDIAVVPGASAWMLSEAGAASVAGQTAITVTWRHSWL